jgi:hypothetical protein
MKEEKRFKLPSSHHRQDWSRQVLPRDLTWTKRVFQVDKCEERIAAFVANRIVELDVTLREALWHLSR